jgi:hypothetical protein
MKPWLKWSLVTLVVGAITFVLTPLWPVPSTAPQPPGSLLPLFVLLVFIESVSFGLGIAFVVFGRPLLRRMVASPRLAAAAYVAVAWLLLNWWPHDNLHRISGGDWNRLVLIEYGFHLPLMLAGAVLAWFLVRVATGESARDLSTEPAERATSLAESSARRA